MLWGVTFWPLLLLLLTNITHSEDLTNDYPTKSSLITTYVENQTKDERTILFNSHLNTGSITQQKGNIFTSFR